MYMYVLKLNASQTKTFVLLVNQEGQDLICVNNVIPGTNLSVKLDMHFIHLTTHEIQIYFRSCIAKENSSYWRVLNLHLKVWKHLLIVFMVLFCCSFGSRSKRLRVLQLLKMLIRLCLMWDGLVLLYWNFVFKPGISLAWFAKHNGHVHKWSPFQTSLTIHSFGKLYKTIIQRSAGE